jgi:four helix bundle protein
MFSYEKLIVYQKAYQLNRTVYQILKSNQNLPFYVKNQLGRASLSIVLNIAEGSAKFGFKDRRNFYITARGSVFECAALINFLGDEQEISPEIVTAILMDYDVLSRMLFGLIQQLNSKTNNLVKESE